MNFSQEIGKLAFVLLVAFVALKIAGPEGAAVVAAWSWWWALAPVVGSVIVAVIYAMIKKQS